SINTFEAVSRNLLRSIDQLPGVYVFGLLSMIISKENRRLGDYVAGTIVVHERSSAELHPELQELPPEPAAVTLDSTGLTAGDLELIETFLHRRVSFSNDVRVSTAIRIAKHVEGKMPPGQRQADVSDEDFLQQVAVAIRDRGR